MLTVQVVEHSPSSRNWFLPLAIVTSILLLVLPEAEARATGEVCRTQFNWDPVDSPLVSGYKVHWGTESGVYTQTFDAGNTTQVVIEEFFEGTTYYSAVTAYSDTGDESDFSEEISFVCPPSTEIGQGFRVSQMSVAAENQITFDIAGTSSSQIEVYVSSDLIQWDLLSTVPNSGGPITITDPGAEGQTKRYYRLKDVVDGS